jgi:hypothetical protein
MTAARWWWIRSAVLALAAVAACATSGTREGLDINQLPADVRPDYDLFTRRCSKCHPLARALNSGIDQDEVWASYVARMRRQPSSGISREDASQILRFLHYYSLEQQRKKGEHATQAAAMPPPGPDRR